MKEYLLENLWLIVGMYLVAKAVTLLIKTW